MLDYIPTHNPKATTVMYCLFGFNFKGERDNNADLLCFEVVA